MLLLSEIIQEWFCKPRTNSSRPASKPKECFRCGGTFDKGHLENCKAKGKSCFNCGRQNHFSKVCKQTVRHVETYSDSEDEASDYKSDNLIKSNPPFINNLLPSSKKARVKLNDGIEISMIIDSGSPINIIDKQTFENIQKQKRHMLKNDQ